MKTNNEEFQNLLISLRKNEQNNYDSKIDNENFKIKLKDILNKPSSLNIIDGCRARSFFTFDHQMEQASYTPPNQDFNKHYDFVFSGCSQTQGWDISPYRAKDLGDHNYIWGFQIANKYNVEALNLGLGGLGAESIVKGLMHYFQKIGHPKVVLVLFPDLGRMEFVDNNKILPKSENESLINVFPLSISDDFDYDKISKAPHKLTDVLTWSQAFYRNIQSIIFLDQYCKANNIYLKYSSWDSANNLILETLQEVLSEYSNYCKIDTNTFNTFSYLFGNRENTKNANCHKDLEEKIPQEIWNTGIDNWHMGVHQHTHIAEIFSEALDNDNPWS